MGLNLRAVLAVMLVAGAALAVACGDDDDVDGASPTPYATIVVEAPIESVDILIRESFPPQYAAVVVSGLPGGCARFDNASVTGRSGNEIAIRVSNTMPADPNMACTAIYGYHETTVELGTDFVSGEAYTVIANGVHKDFVAQ